MAKRRKLRKQLAWRSVLRVRSQPIAFSFDLGRLKLTAGLKAGLEGAAREQVNDQLSQGCSSGTLCFLLNLGDDDHV
jgi:hypothetical protein